MKIIIILLILLYFVFSKAQSVITEQDRENNVYEYKNQRWNCIRAEIPDQACYKQYGPYETARQKKYPKLRDFDKDGIPNYKDYDDDNDGYSDRGDIRPYDPMIQN